MDAPQLDPATREQMIRRAWYAHDARWFAAVAAECGMEVANRLNRAAVRSVGQVEAGRLARALGLAPTQEIDAFLELMRAGLDLYVPPPLMQVSIEKVDARSYEVAVEECFVYANVEKAASPPSTNVPSGIVCRDTTRRSASRSPKVSFRRRRA